MTELIMMRNKIKELERKLETAINALEFYGANWCAACSDYCDDRDPDCSRELFEDDGEAARQALKEIKGE